VKDGEMVLSWIEGAMMMVNDDDNLVQSEVETFIC
jgi:hypothetical protein